ncbi:MAG: hypothetical protein Q8900_03165 [Bacillota bacterium]|nr:hypothetical protein [Bacillota bacterium]
MEELCKKYEIMFNEIYQELVDKFYKKSYFSSKMKMDNKGNLFAILSEQKQKPIKRLTFEDIKSGLVQELVDKEAIGKYVLDSKDVMKDVLGSITLCYMAIEARKAFRAEAV